jgi:dihydroneopterin aldolase
VGGSILPAPGYRCVVVEELRLPFFIGVHDYEKHARQEVSISVWMFVPDVAGRLSDDLADHVSYSDVVAKVKERAKSMAHVNLVETLAEEIAQFAFADSRVESVIVDVRKTEIVPEARRVGVIIRRERSSSRGTA